MLIRSAGILLAAAFFIAIWAMLAPGIVLAPEDPDPAERTSVEFAVALEEFGAEGPGNYCTVFLGGPSVRPERAVLVKVRHAEKLAGRSAHVTEVLKEHARGRLYAWMDMRTGTMYITNHYLARSARERRATQFHEVRAHWELLLSDRQLQAVLCPTASKGDTACITRAILGGCPTLKGMTTEQAYAIAIAAGPFLAVD